MLSFIYFFFFYTQKIIWLCYAIAQSTRPVNVGLFLSLNDPSLFPLGRYHFPRVGGCALLRLCAGVPSTVHFGQPGLSLSKPQAAS